VSTIKLADIQAGWEALEDALEANGGELTPELEQVHDVLNLALADKVDGYVLYLRSIEEQAKGLKALEQEFAAKRATIERRRERLKARVLEFMQARGLDRVKGAVLPGFRKQANGGKRKMDVAENVPLEKWPRSCLKLVVDEAAVRSWLEGTHPGDDCPGVEAEYLVAEDGTKLARLLPPGEHVRIA
jgi:hypothetical protein